MLAPLTSKTRPDGLYDVAVIGAGPAGIALALVLALRGRRVFLAEGGGLEFDERSQDIYKGRVEGDEYMPLEQVRLRQFGGSSGHWGGFCRELDPQDFQSKAASAETAWPITAADLRPYTSRAMRLLLAPAAAADVAFAGGDLKRLNYMHSGPDTPVRFGDFYRSLIERRQNLEAFTNCNFVGFQLSGARVASAAFANWRGERVQVRARQFVMACGGIENARLLLHENRRHQNRLGNQSGLVGAYWSEHFTYPIGEVLVLDQAAFRVARPDETPMWGPTPQLLARRRVLNFNVETRPPLRSGVKGRIEDLLCRAPNLAMRIAAAGRNIDCLGSVHIHLEQEPLRSNRVDLAGETDEFGIPRAVLKVRKSALDRRTIRVAAEEYGRFVAAQDVARFRLAPWLLRGEAFPQGGEIANYHHMGGTRMAASAARGVVDPNCKVFGAANLYVAGSSVFPSGGHANPTLTIVKLALRLADHLSGVQG